MTEILERLDYGDRGRVWIVDDAAALALAAAELVIGTVHDAVDRDGDATIALSGGSTPKEMGRLLASDGFRDRVPWANLQIFWGDERWVPLDSPESNAGEAKRAFLDMVDIPPANVHPFPTEDVSPEQSARQYEEVIRSVVGAGSDGTPGFDLILLGMGDDGHTASLFPGTAALHQHVRLVVPNDIPKLNTTRLTLTAPLLNAGRNVVFLAAGAGKAERLAEVLDGPIDVDRLPSQLIRPAGGPTWLVDRAAAASLAKLTER